MYAWEPHAFSDLGSEMNRSGLSAQVLDSARSYMGDLGLSDGFLNDVVESYARARFAQNLDGARGLST